MRLTKTIKIPKFRNSLNSSLSLKLKTNLWILLSSLNYLSKQRISLIIFLLPVFLIFHSQFITFFRTKCKYNFLDFLINYSYINQRNYLWKKFSFKGNNKLSFVLILFIFFSFHKSFIFNINKHLLD